jgi:hypothetical protein
MAQNGPEQFHASFPRCSAQYDRWCVQLGGMDAAVPVRNVIRRTIVPLA